MHNYLENLQLLFLPFNVEYVKKKLMLIKCKNIYSYDLQ